MLSFKLYVDTKLTEILHIRSEIQLEIFITNKFQYFVLTKISSQNIIIVILEYLYPEITK